MVILGGLEIAFAGYLIHRHRKNEKERRLEVEAAHSQRQRHEPRSCHAATHHQTRPNGRKRPHDRRYPEEKHTYEGRKPAHEPVPQQIFANTSQNLKPNSAPPQEYPPTGWPAHWEQSHPQNTTPYPPTNYHYTQHPPTPINSSQSTESFRERSGLPQGRFHTQHVGDAAPLSPSSPIWNNTHQSHFDPPPSYKS